MEIAPGHLVGKGRFEVLARIGAGGAGLVYEVRDRESDAHLALKTVRSIYRPDTLMLLKREFRAAQDLAHPNLVRLDELFEEDGVWFFTMELIDGIDWLSYVRPDDEALGGPYESRVRATLPQIVEALSALHAVGTVHRDVKPSNVLVSTYGSVKLLDFGLASQPDRMIDPLAEGLVGTLNYMAPELLRMREAMPACDFYALGVMLYQALTGKFPFFERAPDVVRPRLSADPTPVRDVAPDAPADLAALCDALLRRDPHARPTGPSVLRMLGAGAGPWSGELFAAEHFVGRARELNLLGDAFADVRQGGTVTVVIEGASGVGKSTLVRQFLLGLKTPALVLDGRCHEREYVPYKGLDAIMDQLASHLADPGQPSLDLDPTALRLLPRLFPVLRNVRAFVQNVYGTVSSVEAGSRELRSRTFRAFRELIAEVARDRPLVLAIDDVQWADSDTLDLLGDTLGPPEPPPILLICTRRVSDDGADDASTPARFPGDVRRISLGGLSPDEVSTLASRLSEREPLEEGELGEIVAESEGHPLFLQEIVRRRVRGVETTAGVRLDEALWSRVSQLGEQERQIVEAVTIAGIPTELDLIAEAAAIPRRDLPRCMAALRGANLVRLTGTNEARRIEPYHDRVREAIAAHLDTAKGKKWHERLASALERHSERDVEQLAVHREGAGDVTRAAALFREAAERASAALAFDRAADFYRRSLALAGGDTPDAATQKAYGEALFNAGRGAEAGRAFLVLAGEGSEPAAIDFQRRAAQAFLVSGHFAEGTAALRRTMTAAGLPLPHGRLSVIASVFYHRMRVRLRGLALRSRDPSTISSREIMRVDASWSAAHGFAMTDAMTGAIFHARGARMALDLGDPARAARAICSYAISLSTAGPKGCRRAAGLVEAARALRREESDPFIEAFAEGAEGFIAYMLEDWATALVHYNEAEARYRDHVVGATFELDTCRTMMGRTLAHLGRLTELDRRMTPLLFDAIRRNDVYSMLGIRTNAQVLLALARDDVAAAEQEVSESERLLSTQGFHVQHVYWLVAAGMVDLYRGTPELALARIEAHKKALRQSLLEQVQSVRVMMLYLRVRVHLALAARAGRDAETHLEQAARCARRLLRENLPASTALGCMAGGAVSILRRDEPRARSQLREAIERYDRAHMALHAAAARYVLGGLVGGDEARALVVGADDYFDKQRVVARPRFVELHVTGTCNPK